MYSIKLSDGTVIDNLEMNGNNYIPQSSIDVNVFEGKMDKITITDDDGEVEEINNFIIVFTEVGGHQSFIIHNKTKEEVERETLVIKISELQQIIDTMLGVE